MGKSKHRKRGALRRRVGAFDSESLWVLLIAAGASPSARHKWIRVGVLIDSALNITNRSGRTAESASLDGLLDTAADALGSNLASYEDYLPEDPRDDVRVAVFDQIYRLGPGEVERPVADVDRALMVSEAVDAFLIERNGFGVRDVLEVVLRYQDFAIESLATAWPAGDIDFDSPTTLDAAEVAAAARLVAQATPPSVATSERHQLALDWITCPVRQFAYEPGSRESPVGRYLRVHDDTWPGPRWLPLHLFPGALARAVTELAGQVADVPQARRRFAEVVAAEVRRCLWRFGGLVYGPPDVSGVPRVSPANVVQWVSSPTPRHSVLVQVLGELGEGPMHLLEEPEAMRASRAVTAVNDGTHTVTGVDVRMVDGGLTVLPGAEVVPLAVVASPSHVAARLGPEIAAVSLDDLRWMAATSDSKSDLYNYCRDMTRPDLPMYMGWESIDIWEWWRSNNKSFFSGGLAPTFISVAPHSGTAEWLQAAQRTPLEVALNRLGLPPLRDMQTDPEEDHIGPRTLAAWDRDAAPRTSRAGEHVSPPLKMWSVHVSAVPVAVEAMGPGWTEDHLDFGMNLAIGLAYAFDRMVEIWTHEHDATPINGYVIRLSPTSDADTVLSLADTTRETFHATGERDVVHAVVQVSFEALDDAAATATTTVHRSMAQVVHELTVAAGLSPEAGGRIGEAVLANAPTFAIETLRPVTMRNDLRLPVSLDPALVSEVDRKVATVVRDQGVQPGEYSGDTAKALDRDVLAPAALTLLEEAVHIHAMDDLLIFGMEQLERCLAHKTRAQMEARHATELLEVSFDPLDRLEQSENELNLLRRSIEAALETTMRASPTGNVLVDELTWGAVLAAARAYLAATMRSEALHHQVGNTVLHISSSFELSVRPGSRSAPTAQDASDGSAYDLDHDAYKRSLLEYAMAEHHLEPSRPDTQFGDAHDDQHDQQQVRQEGSEDGSGLISDHLDEALVRAFGASADDVFRVLTVAASWRLNEGDRDAFAVEAAALVDEVLPYVEHPATTTIAESRERVVAAIGLLTSTSVDLAAADWRPWQTRSRQRRILVQPLVQRSDGQLVVAPRLCMATATIYLHYLQQGQLPWSQPPAPRELDRALALTRDDRNVALERRVADVLREAGWTVITNVKEAKAGRLNVPTLQTEIDVVAGRPGSPDIWLLEVKDPADVFAPADIRRFLDRFFRDGKSKPSYATQLSRKLADLAPYAPEVASALGLPPADEITLYRVRAAFVTRVPTAAQFVSSDFPFIPLGALVDRLNESD